MGLVVVIVAIVAVIGPGGENDPADSLDQQSATRENPSQPQISNITPADYEIVEEELIEPPNQRDRWVVRVRMDANASDEAKALGIVDAVNEADRSHGSATIIIVFAYSGTDVGGLADIGRGYTSDDGMGMAGDGDGLIADDREGTIQVEVSGAVTYYDK